MLYTPPLVARNMLRGSIAGLTYSNNGSDATNDLDIAAGGCMDATGTDWIEIAATTKQSDVAWAADNGGTPSGALDTGAVGNSDYHIFAIKNPTSGATGILYSLSSSSPTMPSGYTLKRLIGWFRRLGGAITAFNVLEITGGGVEFLWTTPTLDKDVSNLGAARITDAIRGPTTFRTHALLSVLCSHAASATAMRVCCPDEADAAPSLTAAPLANFRVNATGHGDAKDLEVRTSATGTVAARADTASTIYRFITRGWRWSRR